MGKTGPAACRHQLSKDSRAHAHARVCQFTGLARAARRDRYVREHAAGHRLQPRPTVSRPGLTWRPHPSNAQVAQGPCLLITRSARHHAARRPLAAPQALSASGTDSDSRPGPQAPWRTAYQSVSSQGRPLPRGLAAGHG